MRPGTSALTTAVSGTELGYPPLLPAPRKYPEWHSEPKVRTDRSGIILLMCRHLLRLISSTSRWYERVEALLRNILTFPLLGWAFPMTGGIIRFGLMLATIHYELPLNSKLIARTQSV